MIYKAAYIKTYFDNMILPYLAPDGLTVTPDTYYLVNTKFGEDIGLATTDVREITRDKFFVKKAVQEHNGETDIAGIEIDDTSILDVKDEHIPTEIDKEQVENFKILKPVTEEELRSWQSFREEEKRAYHAAKKEICELKLDMKLINVHFLYQKKKIIFNFTADNRIDFRQLVKRLAGLFKTRIEMRQIGVRDAAKIIGSYGVCGIVNCCMRTNCHINSIYLKMAKDQGFVVNSSKLTGSCGRLMCCLSYEAQFYNEERKEYPAIGSVVADGLKNYTVSSHNIIKREVYVCDENHHQKKYPLDSIKFLKKDSSGISVYRTSAEAIKPADNTGIQEEI
ncbi:MAG: regulatory iron-sulfur-containing complex subunit RicT [Brevinematales bacterium]|jgi:cell fate regulator YaaT (PSP1 superfamily)